MANLHATIIVRTVRDGHRKFTVVDKDCGPADYYIRFCMGSKPVTRKAGSTWEQAELAKLRQESKLRGGVIVPELKPNLAHHVSLTITAYLEQLRENRRPARSIKAKETELRDFARRCRKQYVEEITRKDLIAFRNTLTDEGYANVTVLNRMMSVVTWLKQNPLKPVTGLLKKEDWPDKPDTSPHPYSEKELKAMMEAATPDERLLLRFFLGSGMREQEIAHAEREDLKDTYIEVKPKPQYGWKPKTRAGERKIPLGDALLADLKAHCSKGLLFPNPTTGKPEGHFLRIIKAIAGRADVTGAGCHRFRDTYATDQVRARVLDLRDIAKIMGHENMEMMKLYAAFVDLESEQARNAANASDRFAAKPELVRSA